MKAYLLFISIFVLAGFLSGQDHISRAYHDQAPPLSPYDSVMLAGLPELKAPPFLKAGDLPHALDNSRLPYYRNIYQQVSAECGQVSGIAYNFTYEINRLRDLSAAVAQNQYPPHFPFNFMNGGFGWHGVSYFHSFEILKALGCPDVLTYGGMSAGGDQRWMSGYDKYFAAMKNRIRAVYQIKVNTEEGLLTLKHWLHNHLDGSETGGVASFYANSPWNPVTLPAGTPEEGKSVIVSWGGLPTHAMTVAGYNDSIRYDYNNDGLFTNHLDINGDDTVDMRDWEVGGLLFADGWGSGINFGDSGKCYMMYKTLAEKVYQGGIWNHAMHVLEVKDLDKPALTAKITLKHNKRSMLRVRCGISNDQNSTEPEFMIGFPVFNFQGGEQHMQGGWELEENKTIEFGLDISPLLGYTLPGEDQRLFLAVEERDPEGTGVGEIISFSVIDHSGDEPMEVHCESLPRAINNNGVTYAWLDPEHELNSFRIITEALPTAAVQEPYAVQMQTEGGTEPVKWAMQHAINEHDIQAEADTGGIAVVPEDWDYGFVTRALPFSFPFFGESYDSVFIHPDGFVMFEETYHPWPYLYDPALMIRQTECIAPLLCRSFRIDPASGQGMLVNTYDEHITLRWIAKIDDPVYSPTLDFGLELHEDGSIIFVYNTAFLGHKANWSCGISRGDDLNVHIPAWAEDSVIGQGKAVEMHILPLPVGMSISESGLFQGTPTDYYKQYEIVFNAEDDNHVRTFKRLKFSATDLGIDPPAGQQGINMRLYPNPFSDRLTISIAGTLNSPLRCDVHSMNGSLVRSFDIIDPQHIDGTILWNGRDASGQKCPAGVYFIRLRAGKLEETAKVIFVPR